MKRQGNLGHHSKVCNFFSFTGQAQSIHQSSTKSHSNGQYCYPVKFGKNGRYSKQISNCFEQKNMGFFVEQRDHSYCIISPKVTQCGGRYLVQDNKGCKRVKVKCQNIPKDFQTQRKIGERSFCFLYLIPITHLYLMETGPLQPREGCLPNFLDQRKCICLSPILSNKSGLKKDSFS